MLSTACPAGMAPTVGSLKAALCKVCTTAGSWPLQGGCFWDYKEPLLRPGAPTPGLPEVVSGTGALSSLAWDCVHLHGQQRRCLQLLPKTCLPEENV